MIRSLKDKKLGSFFLVIFYIFFIDMLFFESYINRCISGDKDGHIDVIFDGIKLYSQDYAITLHNIISAGYSETFFFMLDFIIITLSVSVITSNSPIVAILFLIALFLVVSCRLIITGITFIGLSYLLVYVGAVSMLFLFILMLINIKLSELYSYSYNIIPLAFYIGLSVNYAIWQMLPSSIYDIYNNGNFNNIRQNYYNSINNELVNDELLTSSVYWDASIYEITHMIQLGNLIYSNYFIWLVITSVILLLSMVGAIIITMKK